VSESQPRFRRPPGWVSDQAPPSGQRLTLRRLADAVRELIALSIDTTAPGEELEALAAELERLRDRLRVAPHGRTRAAFGQAAGQEGERAFFDTSPVVGLANPIAPPLRLSVEGECVVGEVTFGDAYEGPTGCVHGGFVAAAFDDVLGAAQSATDNPGMTGTLTVRYRRPTPLHRPLRFEGRVLRVEGRKIFTAASLHADGVLCAEAEAVFVSIDFAAMFQRMNGQPGDAGSGGPG